MELASHGQENGWHDPDENRGVDAMDIDLNSDEQPRVTTDRSAYVRSVKEKLAEKRATLELVKRKVNRAAVAGRSASNSDF